jgi:2-polyprenyl-3-methyl-5-hydroxy-6-metoxy-1,4-benzoquinol methylase
MSAGLRKCEVCGGQQHVTLTGYTTTEWKVVECSNCRHVYLSTVPGYAALESTYAWEKTFAQEKDRRAKRSWSKFDKATRLRLRLGKQKDMSSRKASLGSSGNVLDVGCGGSCRLHEGVTPYGIEISAELAQQAKPQYEARGGDVVCAPALEAFDKFSDGFFKSILMRSYLEHEENPRAVLTKAFAKLEPGGVIFVRVPNYGSINRRVMGKNWCGFRFPDHVNYFTGASLSTLAGSIGYTYRHKNWLSVFDDNLIVELVKPA